MRVFFTSLNLCCARQFAICQPNLIKNPILLNMGGQGMHETGITSFFFRFIHFNFFLVDSI